MPMAKRQVKAVIDHQIIGNVLHTQRFFGLQIVVVLGYSLCSLAVKERAGVVGIAQQLAEGIGHLQDIAVRHAQIVLHLQRVIGRVTVTWIVLQHSIGILRMRF